MDLRGVVGADPGEVLGGVTPPLTLFGPVAVAACMGLGGEADHGDAPAVFGDPSGGPEPAVGVGGELSLPAAQISADPGWVGRPHLDDLNEHGIVSFSAMSLASIPSLLQQRLGSGGSGWLGATGGHERGSLGRGEECGFLDLVDRALLVAVLDPACAAAGADGDRVQTEGDGDQGRSAQRATRHQRTPLRWSPWLW